MACIFHDMPYVFRHIGKRPRKHPENHAPQTLCACTKGTTKSSHTHAVTGKKANFVFSSTLGQNHVRVSERTTKHGAVHTRRRRKSK